MGHRLGIDLGGTSAKIAIVNSVKKIVRESSVSTLGFPSPGRLIENMALAAQDLAQGGRIERIGVGVAGDIDSTRGVVRVSPNLGWSRVPLGPLLERRLKCPVSVDNDANAAAWGLYHTQVSSRVRNMIAITLGTGVGGGLILNGDLYRGATGSAGEIGHMRIEEDGPLCNCGNRGCLETYVGGPHIVARVQAELARGRRSRLQTLFRNDPRLITPLALSKAALAGDGYALSVWKEVGTVLGRAVGDLIYVFNPDAIVFTGGVAQAGDLILKPLWKKLEERPFKTPVRAVTIKVASQASHIGVIGAALL